MKHVLRFVVVWLFVVASASTAAPEIRDVNIRGLQIGGTTTLVIDGTDLLPAPRVVLSVPIAKQTLRPGTKPNRIEVDVTIGGSVQPGFYNLWVANSNGISKAVVVALDRLSQQPFAAEVKTTPIALHGKLSGSTRMRTTFSGKKGQSLILEVEAQRLGAKIRPVLHLYDSQSRQIAWSLPSRTLRGDARLQVRLPADGNYTAELHDLQYAAPAPNHFRWKIGNWRYADLVFPIAVERGKSATVQLIGNGSPGKAVSLTASNGQSGIPAPWSEAVASSGPQPSVLVSGMTEIVEAPGGKTPLALPSTPVGVSGRLEEPGEQDRYQLAVKPGDRLRFDVFADRIGSPIDPALELQNDKGGVLASNDDFGGTADSRIEYTVPTNVSRLIVAVKDVNGRGGRRCIYRLAVTQPNEPPVPDFRLTLEKTRINVPRGGRRIVKVTAERLGYDGPIQLSIVPSPAGVRVEGNVIAAGASSTLLTFVGSASGVAQSIVTIRGTSVGANPVIQRVGLNRNDAVSSFQPWLAEEAAIAVVGKSKSGFAFAFELPAGKTKLVLGGRVKIPVKCTRLVGFDGPVRLTLLSSQVAPLIKGRPNPNLTLRAESRAVEIPADRKAQVAYDAQLAAEKLLAAAKAAVATGKTVKAKAAAQTRLNAAAAKFAAARKAAAVASAAAKNRTELSLLVPAGLAKSPYQLAIRAELLSRNKQKVIAQTVTSVRLVDTLNPIAITHGFSSPVKATRNPKTGSSVIITGKIARRAGLKGDVTVSLTGLPAGVAVPRTVVKAGKTDYRLEFKVPVGNKQNEIKNVTVVATGRIEARLPVVRAESSKFTIKILPALAKKR